MHVRLAVVTAACAAAVMIALVTTHSLTTSSPTTSIGVTVEGLRVRVARGTTVAQLDVLARLHARAGDLLDARGRILRRGAYPGEVLLNGAASRPSAVLQAGDRVRIRDGRDRREPLRREVVPVPDGMPEDPQTSLARVAGNAVVLRGALTSEVVSTSFRPAGLTASPPEVALTFDDGPSPTYTPAILHILHRAHVEATFFLVGYLAGWYPQLVAQEIADGMEVGNHSFNHPEVPPFGQLPSALSSDEIRLATGDLRAAGADPDVFRPPAGSFSPGIVRAADLARQRVVLWSVDPADWRPGVTARAIAMQVLRAIQPGSIVLLHDGGGNRSATVAALPAIINGVRRRGLRFVTVDGG